MESTPNRGFNYGDGFFETVRLINSEAVLLDYHLARAKQCASALEMDWSSHWDEAFFRNQIEELNINRLPVVRINFYRSGAGTYVPETNAMEVQFTFREMSSTQGLFSIDAVDADDFEQRIKVQELRPIGIYREELKPINTLSQYKTSSSLFYVLAGLYLKKQSDLDDLVLINSNGDVCEGLSSNILLKFNERWISPSLDQGPVEGVYLSYLQSTIPIERCPVSISMLEAAQEVLFLNAVQGVRRMGLVR